MEKHPVTPRSDSEKQAVVNRLKRIEGQVRGMQKIGEEPRSCISLSMLISATAAALKKVGFEVAERHVKHCVRHAVESGDGNEAVDELLAVLKQFSK